MRSAQCNRMAGNLYLPNGFRESEQYRAIVSVHPGGGAIRGCGLLELFVAGMRGWEAAVRRRWPAECKMNSH
jgi:hypothetical protein